MLKSPKYRNKKLLRLAAECPYCMICGKPNEGDVVAMHSNSQYCGKGIGVKAHDLPAYGCYSCHKIIDELIDITKEDAELMWYRGMFKSFLWLLESGHLS